MAGIITREKKGRPKDDQLTRTKKKGRKLIPLMVGNKLTHVFLMSIACRF
jgi:hypothetical protein